MRGAQRVAVAVGTAAIMVGGLAGSVAARVVERVDVPLVVVVRPPMTPSGTADACLAANELTSCISTIKGDALTGSTVIAVGDDRGGWRNANGGTDIDIARR